MKKTMLFALCFTAISAFAGPVKSINISTVGEEFKYDKTKFTVKAGSEVSITFTNKSKSMPHNLIMLKKDAKYMDVAAQGAMAGMDKGFVPASPEVTHATKLLQPGKAETLKFTAPTEPGNYPYVCSFPGHAATMNGVMEVVK